MPIIDSSLIDQAYCPECGFQALYDPDADHIPYIFTGTLDDDAPYISSTMSLVCQVCCERFYGRISRYWWGPFDGSVSFEERKVTYEDSSTPRALSASLCPTLYAKETLKLTAEQQAAYTAVQDALYQLDEKTALRLLSEMTDMPARKLWTWLRTAVYCGLPDIISYCYPRLPHPDEKTQKKLLIHAIHNLQLGSYKTLVACGATPTYEYGLNLELYDPHLGRIRKVSSALELAILLGDMDVAKLLIPLRNSTWLTGTFFYAVETNQQELFPLFEAQGCSGTRAIAHFIRQNKPECVQRLLAADSDLFGVVYRKTGDEWVEETNLHVAARHGMQWVVEHWLQHHPDISHVVATDGTTPYQEAISNQHLSIAELLKQHGSPAS